MKFTQDTISPVSIRKVERGEIIIGDKTITDNVVLTSDHVVPTWQVTGVSGLAYEDLDDHLRPQTEIVLLGTGWQTEMPSRELVFSLARRGIGFEFMDTPAACRTFNILVGEGRDVTAFLMIR